MRWFKQALLDLIVTLAILLLAAAHFTWLEIPLMVYTVFVFLMKLVGWSNRELLRRMKKAPVPAPDWFYHLLYAVNVIALGASQRWITSMFWALIWLVSWLISRKLQSRKAK